MLETQWKGGREGWIGEAQGIFKGKEPIPYDTLMVDTYHYTHVKMNRIHNTKNEA